MIKSHHYQVSSNWKFRFQGGLGSRGVRQTGCACASMNHDGSRYAGHMHPFLARLEQWAIQALAPVVKSVVKSVVNLWYEVTGGDAVHAP